MSRVIVNKENVSNIATSIRNGLGTQETMKFAQMAGKIDELVNKDTGAIEELENQVQELEEEKTGLENQVTQLEQENAEITQAKEEAEARVTTLEEEESQALDIVNQILGESEEEEENNG